MKYEKNQPQPDMNKGEIKTGIDNWRSKPGSKREDHPYMKENSYSPWLSVKTPKIAGDLLTHYPNGNKFEM